MMRKPFEVELNCLLVHGVGLNLIWRKFRKLSMLSLWLKHFFSLLFSKGGTLAILKGLCFKLATTRYSILLGTVYIICI